MAKPPKTTPLGRLLQPVFPLPGSTAPAPTALLPASVSDAWDTLRVALGRTVPANVTAANASRARILKAVR